VDRPAFATFSLRNTKMERVVDEVADLSLRVAFDGLRPTPMPLNSIRGGRIGGEAVPPSDAVKTSISAGRLLVEGSYTGRLFAPGFNFLNQRGPENGFIDGDPDIQIDARFTSTEVRTTKVVVGHPPSNVVTYGLSHWTAYKKTPVVWVGHLDTDLFRFARGNLFLTDTLTGRSSVSSFLFRGTYRWSIIPVDKEAFVLIDTSPLVLDLELLAVDFAALQLTFGSRLTLHSIGGLDRNGVTVAWAGSSSLTRGQTKSGLTQPPIPMSLQYAQHCFAADFFHIVVPALREPDSDNAWIALNSILGIVDEDSLDTIYLKLQVALEAFSASTKKPKKDLLVEEPKAWLSWVDGKANEISAFASNGNSQRFINKVRSAINPPATDAVEDALKALSIAPPADLRAELRGRNVVVHRFLMNKNNNERDLLHDWGRTRMLRELLVAMFCRKIGYSSPINSWLTDRMGHSLPAAWWPTSAASDEAVKQYIYTRP
jgi:hypothetical protein